MSNKYRDGFVEHGLVLSGLSPDESLVEIVELPEHPWYVGCQFHPELKSRPTRPHPLFASFIEAALAHKNSRGEEGAAKGGAKARGDKPVMVSSGAR